jgi:heme A synthase
MAFFAWATGMRFRLRDAAPAPTLPHRTGVLIAAGAVYLQLVLGAVVRHKGASLSCGLEALTCLGGWLPATDLQWLQTAHRVFAVGVTAAVIAGTLKPIKAARLAGRTLARRLGVAAHALVLAQVLMGVLTIKTAVHMHVVTTHLALGALLWVDLLAFFWALGPLGGPVAAGTDAPAGVVRPAAVV